MIHQNEFRTFFDGGCFVPRLIRNKCYYIEMIAIDIHSFRYRCFACLFIDEVRSNKSKQTRAFFLLLDFFLSKILCYERYEFHVFLKQIKNKLRFIIFAVVFSSIFPPEIPIIKLVWTCTVLIGNSSVEIEMSNGIIKSVTNWNKQLA